MPDPSPRPDLAPKRKKKRRASPSLFFLTDFFRRVLALVSLLFFPPPKKMFEIMCSICLLPSTGKRKHVPLLCRLCPDRPVCDECLVAFLALLAKEAEFSDSDPIRVVREKTALLLHPFCPFLEPSRHRLCWARLNNVATRRRNADRQEAVCKWLHRERVQDLARARRNARDFRRRVSSLLDFDRKATEEPFQLARLHDTSSVFEALALELQELSVSATQMQLDLKATAGSANLTNRACPRIGCEGFLSSEGAVCLACETRPCPDCGLSRHPPEEPCRQEDVSSHRVLADREEIRPCPSCAVPIMKRKNTCNDMWCSRCETGFHWRTGALLHGDFHNPERAEAEKRRNALRPADPKRNAGQNRAARLASLLVGEVLPAMMDTLVKNVVLAKSHEADFFSVNEEASRLAFTYTHEAGLTFRAFFARIDCRHKTLYLLETLVREGGDEAKKRQLEEQLRKQNGGVLRTGNAATVEGWVPSRSANFLPPVTRQSLAAAVSLTALRE